jgi:hypothetical protein
MGLRLESAHASTVNLTGGTLTSNADIVNGGGVATRLMLMAERCNVKGHDRYDECH